MPPKDDDFIKQVRAEFEKNYASLLRSARACLHRRARNKSDQEAEDLVHAAYQAICDRREYNPKYTLEQFIFNTIDSLAKDIPRSGWLKNKKETKEPTGDEEEEPPPSDRDASAHANAEQLVAQKEEAEQYEAALDAAVEHHGPESIEAKYVAALREGITDDDELAEKLGVTKAEIGRIADRVDYRIEKILEDREKQQRVKALELQGKKKKS